MKQRTVMPLSVLAIAILLHLTSCKKDPIEPLPNPLPPQQELPNPLPAFALVKQLKWSELDFEKFQYNDQNQVERITSQYQFVEGDPTKIRTMIYDFVYDSADRPVRVNTSSGYDSRYYYNHGLIAKTEELTATGAVAKEVTFSYVGNRVSHEHWRIPSIVPGEPDDIYMYAFSYDGKGNLNKISQYEKQDNNQYKLLETTEYSDFDDNINPTSWKLRYPYLPQMRFQYNNPRKEVRTQASGSTTTTTFAYEYNGLNLPVSKQTSTPGGIFSVQYIY